MGKQKNSVSHLTAWQVKTRPEQGLTEQLIDSIKSWVLQGVIAPNDRLPPERELAARLKVSRSSLRQALKTLEVMGVLAARQGSGTYLTELAEVILRQPTDLLVPLRGVSFAELFEARRAMEIEAVSSAATHATQDDISELAALVDRMHKHLSHPAAYYASDVAFHRKIAHVSGNSVFVWFNEMVVKVMAEAWRKRAQQGDNTRSTYLEHRAILEAIQQRDPHAARSAMLTHLDLSKFYSQAPMRLELRVVGVSNAAA